MDAVAALQQVFRVQYAFEIIATLFLTAYLFPKQAEVEDFHEFDMIVVGAGSAGTVVALRLAECNFKVLLIDAGGDPPVQSLVPGLFPYLSHTEYDWNYTNVRVDDRFQCHRDKTINLTSGHVLGGGSSINYLVYVRGCPGDFRYWAEAANDSSWDYEGLLPFFKKSERLEDRQILSSRYRVYHGTKGFLGVTKNENPAPHILFHGFRELGNAILLDVNGDRSLGYSELLVTIAEGVRQSTAYSILAQYKLRNLKVLKNTLVTEVIFDEQNNAIGVKAITEDKKQITFRARKEVILSAGAFNTPKLLMLSGIGPKEHLQSLNISVRKDLPVGKNLQDHAPIIIAFKMEGNDNPPPPTNPHRFPFPAYAGYVALNKTQKCPTYQAIGFLIRANSPAPVNLCVFNYGFDFNICQNLYEAGRNRNILYTTLSLLHPKSRGEVLLRSTDPQDPPLIDVGYLSDEHDLETLVDSAMDYVRVLNTTFFRGINAEMADLKLTKCEGLEYMSREWWRCYVKCMLLTIYHYSGTSALGSVVDSKLRVLGVGRLLVVDASIIPRLPGANTNAAVIAIGEKGADAILKQYSCTAKSHDHNFTNAFPSWGFSGFFNIFSSS